MRHVVSITIALCAAALIAAPAAAQKKRANPAPEPAAEPAPCTCPEAAAPPAPLREGGLAECTDGVDNDRDGHLDCTDQDCEIYAVCALPSAARETSFEPPASARTYANMRELKRDLRAGLISGHDFYNWQVMIRAWREAEFDAARAELQSGQITHAEYKARIAAIRLKYEG